MTLSPPVTVESLLDRITIDPNNCAGKPAVRGRPVSVEDVLATLERGDSAQSILASYPWMKASDILACLLYAQRVAEQEDDPRQPAKTHTQ